MPNIDVQTKEFILELLPIVISTIALGFSFYTHFTRDQVKKNDLHISITPQSSGIYRQLFKYPTSLYIVGLKEIINDCVIISIPITVLSSSKVLTLRNLEAEITIPLKYSVDYNMKGRNDKSDPNKTFNSTKRQVKDYNNEFEYIKSIHGIESIKPLQSLTFFETICLTKPEFEKKCFYKNSEKNDRNYISLDLIIELKSEVLPSIKLKTQVIIVRTNDIIETRDKLGKTLCDIYYIDNVNPFKTLSETGLFKFNLLKLLSIVREFKKFKFIITHVSISEFGRYGKVSFGKDLIGNTKYLIGDMSFQIKKVMAFGWF